ncbi:trypco2 family protein [Streptomyces sp. NPDC051322]|uniref:trypco2 family protein n=1 Tax=Streptomyces sp. NPDC051322 TaxID=3154645 RepID=UPI00344D9E22
MGNGTNETSGIGLADLISEVRAELEEAQRRVGTSNLRLGVRKVGLEITVQVGRKLDANGKLRLGVVTAEGGGSATRENTHRIQIELEIQNAEHAPGWIPVGREETPAESPAG